MKMPGFASLCIHDNARQETTKPHQLPIYATSSFEFENITDGIDLFSGKKEGHMYSRYGNPTVDTVAAKIASLEGFGMKETATGLLVSSGMAAISTVLLGLLNNGDKIISQTNLYGGTTELLKKILQPKGIEVILIDLKNLALVEKTIAGDSKVKVMYFETPANPTMACVDIESLCGIAKKYGVQTAADNTFCTPYLQQPLALGTDFVIHSTTKYLNGHGNSIAGAIVSPHLADMKNKIWATMKLLGTNCSPFDAWLINNGLKTLELRMIRHSSNALAVAHFLDKHPKVKKVNSVGLESHPDYALAQKQMSGPGGMMSFELYGGLDAGIRFMDKIEFCTLAPTLGDVDTLILHPASMSHKGIERSVRVANGIPDGLIRISVGIETPGDIVQDLQQALEAV